MWAFNIFLVEFGLTIGCCLVIYLLWRMAHPGQKW